jgi:hypothetical protein
MAGGRSCAVSCGQLLEALLLLLLQPQVCTGEATVWLLGWGGAVVDGWWLLQQLDRAAAGSTAAAAAQACTCEAIVWFTWVSQGWWVAEYKLMGGGGSCAVWFQLLAALLLQPK